MSVPLENGMATMQVRNSAEQPLRLGKSELQALNLPNDWVCGPQAEHLPSVDRCLWMGLASP